MSSSSPQKATEAQDMCRQINTNYAGMEQSIKGKRRIDHDDDTYNSTIKRLNLEDDVGQELLRIRTDRMASHHQPVFIPPFAKADARAQDNDLFLLVDKVKEFLVSERETMLILGDSGAGKSTFISRLEYELWSEFKTGEPVPLFVNLPSIERPEHGLIAKQLGRLDVSTEHIQALKRDGRQFTVICDGYDESQLTLNLHATNQFNRPGQWRAKLIVTCRSQYLSQSYRDRFVPLGGSHYSRPALHLYQEAAIAPFSKEQVKNYVDIYVPLEPRTWTTQDYMDRLTAIPHLMDLVRNPFLLTLTLESLPGVTKDKQDLSTIKITRLQLYDIFVVHWLEVNKRRLESSTLSFRDRDAMDQLLEADFVSKGIGYCTGLASGIFTHQDGKPIVQYVHLDDRNSWKAEFFCPDPEVQLLRNSSPLTRTGHLYRFMHRSMLEYFLSRAIFEPSISNDYDEFAPQQDSDSSVIQSLDTNGPLFTQDLLKEPSVLQFLYERVPTSPIFKKQLLAVLEQSKSDSGYSRAAANAITILVKARVRFNGVDLRGIRIPDADLFGGQFDTTQFQGADLTNVNLTRSWIRQADFTGAEMSGASVGVLPTMTESCSIYCCAISPDGTLLAAGLEDGRISLYDTSTWTQAATLRGHGRRVTSVAFSPTGSWLVSGSHDSTIRLWDPRTRHPIRILEGHTKKVLKVMLSPNGCRIASASEDKTVRVWDSESGETELIYKGHKRGVRSISWSPDGCRIVSGSYDKTIQVWDSQTGTEVIKRQHDLVGRGAICVEFSPDGQWIVLGDRSYHLELHSATSNNFKRHVDVYCVRISGIVFSPNGRWMATCNSKLVRLWDAETFTERAVWRNHARTVTAVAFSPDSLQVVSCGKDQIICRYEINTVDTTFDYQYDFCPGSTLEYSTDGQYILANHAECGIYRWESMTGVGEQLLVHKAPLKDIVFSPNREQFAALNNPLEYAFRQWTIVNGALDSVLFRGHSGIIKCLAYSPCGSWIASGSSDNTVRLWNLRDGTPGHVLVGHNDTVRTIAFSPNSRQVASGGADCTVRLWDAFTGNLMATLTGHSDRVVRVSYSPDGATIASSSQDRTVRLWNSQTGIFGAEFGDHTYVATCLAFSPCGQWIASSVEGRGIQLRRVQERQANEGVYYELQDFLSDVQSVSWNPAKKNQFDHLEFATGSIDGCIRVWRLSVDEGGVHICLLWGTHVNVLISTNANVEHASGLSEFNRQYLINYNAREASHLNEYSSDDDYIWTKLETESEDEWVSEE